MQEAAWQRWVPFTGIVFVILFIVGLVLAAGPENTSSNEEWLDWYTDSGNQTSAIIGAYFFAVASVALLLFVNRVRATIAEAEGVRPIFSPFIFGSGVILAASVVVLATSLAVVPAGIKFGDLNAPENSDIVRFLPQIGFGMFLVLGMIPWCFGMLTIAYASMRFNVFPSWFNWLTVLCALLLFLAALFFPIIALGVWLIAGSVVLLRHQSA